MLCTLPLQTHYTSKMPWFCCQFGHAIGWTFLKAICMFWRLKNRFCKIVDEFKFQIHYTCFTHIFELKMTKQKFMAYTLKGIFCILGKCFQFFKYCCFLHWHKNVNCFKHLILTIFYSLVLRITSPYSLYPGIILAFNDT